MNKKLFNFIMTILGTIIYILLGWTIIIPTVITQAILDFFFTRRVTPTIICDDNKYYKGLKEDPRPFMSGKNKLYGAFFSHEGHGEYKGVMLVCHGIGCSHKNYLQVIDYFTRKDYLVFAYDMTGCCQSEGDKGMYGMQQAILDVRSAVLFIKSQEETKDMDLYVFGHSLSGYATAAALNFEEVRSQVKALATLAGFNKYWDVMKDQGIKKCGPIVVIAKPFAHIASKFRFGKCARFKGMKGINLYDGPVFVAHSKDDSTVEYKYSLDIIKEQCTNKRAEFHTHENLGHTLYRPTDAEARITANRLGKEPLKLNNENVFQYFMDDRYRFSTREDVFGLNEEYMDMIEDFYNRVREGIC